MSNLSRRDFFGQSLAFTAAALAAGPLRRSLALETPGANMRLGMVTYLWGKDWDLPTLIANCERAEVLGVELRTEHKHGVEPTLNARQRREVKKRFQDTPVVYVGLGTNEHYDDPDPAALKQCIENTKAFIKLSAETGGGGVKVKPNSFHAGVDHRRTVEQIGRSLNIVGRFAGDYGQEIRLEVHGGCSPLPVIKQIMDLVEDPRVGVCWNSNQEDLSGEGLEYNFRLVQDRFGSTAHVRELNIGDYPYQRLIELFVDIDYAGWILLECRTNPPDRVKALIEQREVFSKMLAAAQARRA